MYIKKKKKTKPKTISVIANPQLIPKHMYKLLLEYNWTDES